MNSTARIENIRRRQQPTRFVPFTPCRVDITGGSNVMLPVTLEWYRSVPESVAVVMVEHTGEEIVWEIGRELFHYALTQPGHEFGTGDFAVAVLRPQPMLVSLLDSSNGDWWTVNMDVAPVAGMLARARLEVPMTDLQPESTRPYTRRARRQS